MNDMQKERITQVNQNQEQTEEQHTSSADPLPPPTDDLQKSTERNFKKPEIKDESSSQARRQTDHKKLVTRPRSEQLRIRIKVKKFHQDIEAIFRASFSEHMESTSSVAIDNELERRCHVRTLCPSMTTAVLERLLMSHYEEILLIVKQKGKKTRKSLDRHREMHSQGTYAQDIYVQGSCLDLYACLYEWHSPGKRFALPWEKGEMKSTQQKKQKKKKKKQTFPSDSKCVEGKPNIKLQTSSKELNPYLILCPFELGGTCHDQNCIYQHLNPESRNKISSLPRIQKKLPSIHHVDFSIPDPTSTKKDEANGENNNNEKIKEKNNEDETGFALDVKHNTSKKRKIEKEIMTEASIKTRALNIIKRNTAVISEKGSNPNEKMRSKDEWNGEELDFIALPSATLSPAHDDNDKPTQEKSTCTPTIPLNALFWWWDAARNWAPLKKNNKIDSSTALFPCNLNTFMHRCGISFYQTQNEMFLEHVHSIAFDVDEGAILVQFIAALLDCIRLSIFSGRQDMAVALCDLCQSIIDHEYKLVLVLGSKDRYGKIRNHHRFMVVAILRKAIAKTQKTISNIVQSSSFFSYRTQVSLMLISQALTAFYSVHIESSLVEKSDELSSSPSITKWIETFDQCMGHGNAKIDGSNNLMHAFEVVETSVTEFERCLAKTVIWFSSELSKITNKESPCTDTNSIMISSFRSNTSNGSNLELSKLDQMFKCELLGSCIAKELSQSSNKIKLLPMSKLISILFLVGSFVEQLWSEAINHQYLTRSRTDMSDFEVSCSVLIYAPILFSFLDLVLSCSEGGKVSDFRSILSRADDILYNAIKHSHVRSKNAIMRRSRCTNLETLGFFFINELILAPLISLSVSISINVMNPSKAYEKILFFIANKKGNHHAMQGIIILSEMLWSQLVTLIFCFPDPVGPYKRNQDLISSLVQTLNRYNIFLSNMNLPGDSDLVREARIDIQNEKISVAKAATSFLTEETSRNFGQLDFSLSGVPLKYLPSSLFSLSDRIIKLSISDCDLLHLPLRFGSQFVKLQVCEEKDHVSFFIFCNYQISDTSEHYTLLTFSCAL